jgi:hypothetical protein
MLVSLGLCLLTATASDVSLFGTVWQYQTKKNPVRTGIRSRTVQAVVSRYTDWATLPTTVLYRNTKTIEEEGLR